MELRLNRAYAIPFQLESRRHAWVIRILKVVLRARVRRPLPWPSLARGIPFGIYIGFLVVTPWLTAAFPGIDSRWFYFVKVAAVAVALFMFRRHYTELFASRFARADGAVEQTLAAIAVGFVVFLLWINLDRPWATLGSAAPFERTPEDALDLPLLIVRLVGAALVVPVMEELFWRSWIMRRMDRSAYWAYPPQAVSLQALLLSSLVFGLEHRLWFAGLLAGVAYAEIYRRTGNLRMPVIAHGVTNLLLGLWVLATGSWEFW